MKRLIPDSITGRTVLVLLVGLTLSHLASTAILSNDRHDALIETSDELAADRVAAFARLLDQTPPDERERMAKNISSPLLSVLVDGKQVPSGNHKDEPDALSIRQSLERTFGPIGHDRLHIARHDHDENSVHSLWWRIVNGFPDSRPLWLTFRLSDGAWARFEIGMARPVSWWSAHSILSALVMIAGILFFGRWAAGWVLAPLATFARAADRLGRDVQAPPLSEQGPREVRQAAAAFNEMQSRIRRFVEDRTRMLAAISHDLRSPITRLRLRAEMLPERETGERMLADLDEMEAMVSSTLDFARGEAEAEPSQTVDLAATIQAVCDNAADMGLSIEFDWPGRLVCVCRPLAIKRALANLIENAARYGGKAKVQARHEDENIVAVIDDEGPGIPEPEIEKVFTPFYRLERSRNRKTGGIGLGLTVARTILRAHGGDLRLENRKEGGLRATVTLPQGERQP